MGKSLTSLNFKAQRLTIIVIIGITMALSACGSSANSDFPSLMVVNQNDNNLPILGVSLVNYEFDPIEIEVGESQTFALDDGMPGGFSNIIVAFRLKVATDRSLTYTTEKDFRDGETTIITLKGCRSGQGCGGIYFE